MKLVSPAKVNLFLRVFAKRRDGYHSIRTLFERISLSDEIVLKKRLQGIRLHCSAKGVPRGPKNTAYRAAKLLKERFRVKEGVTIRIHKRIPVRAGLGGGSSNAAFVLLGLNRLWRLRLSRARLLKIAAELGSDVPFFVLQTPFALGTGRGEKLRVVKAGKLRLWHCLVQPRFRISTREAYRRFTGSRLTPPGANAKMLLRSVQREDPGPLFKLLHNSLELVLNKKVTEISEIKNELILRGAKGALLSGSGSVVFGLFGTRARATAAARALRRKRPRRWKTWVASTY